MPIGNPQSPFFQAMRDPALQGSSYQPTSQPSNPFSSWMQQGTGGNSLFRPYQNTIDPNILKIFQAAVQHLMQNGGFNSLTQRDSRGNAKSQSGGVGQEGSMHFTPEQLQHIRMQFQQQQPTAGSRTGMTPAY